MEKKNKYFSRKENNNNINFHNNITKDKEENKTNTKNENSLITTLNNDINYNISYNDKNSFEEIYDENDDDNIYNNYLSNKDFMKNNYLEFKRREILKKIKNAFTPSNNDKNDIFFDDDDNPYIKGKQKSLISEPESIYKHRLNKYISDGDFDFKIKNNRFNTYPNCENKKLKNDSRKYSKFFDEESGFIGNEHFFKRSSSNIKFKDKNKKNKKNNKDFDNDSDFYEENKNHNIIALNKKGKKLNDLLSEDKKDSFGDNSYNRKKRKIDNKVLI